MDVKNMNVDSDYRKKLQVIQKQLQLIEKQEQRWLVKKENTFLKSKLNPIKGRIEGMIPDKLKTTLQVAFFKGFQLVFEKGSTYIERTYSKDKIQLEHDLNNYALDKYPHKKQITRLDKSANRSKLLNSSIAVLEGGVLGVLGIGLPDIPLFISVILRTINEIALSYGYSYENEEEKAYILGLISGALAGGENRKAYSEEVDCLSDGIDSAIVMNIKLNERMKETADVLSDALLTAKFIQGIPIVGIIGGAVNHSVIQKVAYFAKMKYKKRYLTCKLKQL